MPAAVRHESRRSVFPDILNYRRDLAVLARLWIAYYWPFADPLVPIYQGPRRSKADGGGAEDMEFRPALSVLRAEWEIILGQTSPPSDGFVVIGDMMIDRKRTGYRLRSSPHFSKR